MAGWCVFLSVLAVLLLLLAVPVGVTVLWEGSLTLKLRVGPLAFQFSQGKKTQKKEKPAAPRKEKKRPTREQLFYSVDRLGKLAVKLLGRFRRKLRIEPLRLHLEVAGEDPADTAVLYGKLCSALSALMPALREAVAIRGEDLRVDVNFEKTEWTVSARVGLSMRLWNLLGILLGAVFGIVEWRMGYLKLEQPAAAQTTKERKPEDPQAPAA